VIYKKKRPFSDKSQTQQTHKKTRFSVDWRNARELMQSKNTNVTVEAPEASETDPRLNRESPDLGEITSAVLGAKVRPARKNCPTK